MRDKTRKAGLVDPQRQSAAELGGFLWLVGEPANADELREFNCGLPDFETKPRERGPQSVTDAREASSTSATACQRWQFMPLEVLGAEANCLSGVLCRVAANDRWEIERRSGRRGSRRTTCECQYWLAQQSAAFTAGIWPAQINAQHR